MIEIKNLRRSFISNSSETHVLKGIDLVVQEGEFISVVGRSGAGKSTFLYQISLLDTPTSGEVIIDGHDTHLFSEKEKTAFRLDRFGFVFQDYALLPEMTAVENVALPLLMQRVEKEAAYLQATRALERMKLGHRCMNLPSQMSGGEQQRVSIARAIAHNPKILFADEPTANLDNESARTVMDIFDELHREQGQTIIMVTHEEEFAKLAEKTVQMDDGRIVDIVKNR